jgi:PAS domain S-box-containing protein
MLPPDLVRRKESKVGENGSAEVERLFRTVLYASSSLTFIANSDRNLRYASPAISRLLGYAPEELTGRGLHTILNPRAAESISAAWTAVTRGGEHEGSLQVVSAGGTALEVEFSARGGVLPDWHVLVLRPQGDEREIPSWVKDYAFVVMTATGHIAAWYAGAERMFGYPAAEAIGHHFTFLHCTDPIGGIPREEFRKAEAGGHCAYEDWCTRKDGTQFWANVLTVAWHDQEGLIQGFATVVRDFSDRDQGEEKGSQTHPRAPGAPAQTRIPGIVSGDLEGIHEANDAFLDLVGYSRAEIAAGKLRWLDLSPPEYSTLDESAYEESFRFGACKPFEKELTRKDRMRVPVSVTTALLKLSPLRWIAVVHDLRGVLRNDRTADGSPELVDEFTEIVGDSLALRHVLSQVEVVAPTNATVLVLGETGTGKELVARAVHRLSTRRDRPFISLNCAAIPTGLLESELFGYERGAFTGASARKIGRFEMAHEGTLFLDEIGDIPLDLQPKLLRALQEKSFERLGGTKTIPIDVRLIAATNRNLAQMMLEKSFRSDLYYRLNVFPINLPPLRDRPEDIPALVRYFTDRYAKLMNKKIDTIQADTMRALVKMPWPGNIRELENFIERAVIVTPGSALVAPFEHLVAPAPQSRGGDTLQDVEREHVLRVLRESQGVISRAAIRLGMPRTTLNALMRKLNITRKDI